jgi:hypothetical protein
MKNVNKIFLLFMFVAFSAFAFGQTTVSGTVTDKELGETLPGVTVVVKGTTAGAITGLNGKYTIEVPSGAETLVFTYIGMITQEVSVTGGEINVALEQDQNELSEVVVVGVADIVKDRNTPIAVSNITASEIQNLIGTKELPEVLNNTPSIYATKSGGGFGDARINVRGFDSKNTAIMINGMPVNDMENGIVYWSNWAGLTDVTSAIQVQRGLGSSKLAISSVGGTINIITNSANKRKGGSFSATYGSDNYMKYTGAYNTGLTKSGFSASVLLSRWSGDGFVDGTMGQGWTWFLSAGYKINAKHNLMFTATGAPQWHHQRSYANPLSTYINYSDDAGEPNIKYNSDWGYLDGEEFSWRRNFYHKPIASLNWEWDLNSSSKLSTVLYGSWGRGGGSGPIGRINGDREYYSQFYDADGLVRFDDIVTWNSGGTVADFGDDRTDGSPYTNDRSTGFSRRASMNSHDWYGVIANYHNDINDNLSIDLGFDLRTYTGYHYRIVNDVLGADQYFDNRDINNPDRTILPGDFVDVDPSWNPFVNITDQAKIEYYNVGNVRWEGIFGQIEYSTDVFSVFAQGGASYQQFQRIDYFVYPRDDDGDGVDEPQESDWNNLLGGNIKGGFNYNINDNHNVFINAGYYAKQPLFDAVFLNFSNTVNDDLQNEGIFGLELGYGLRYDNTTVKLNLYQTTWSDRFIQQSATFDVNNTPDNFDDDVRGYANLYGIKEIHRGVELEAKTEVGPVKFFGMFSVGDWFYGADVSAPYFDEDNNAIPGAEEKTLYIEGVKVGDAAQLTARIGANYNVFDGLFIDANYFYADKLYAAIDPTAYEDPDGSSEALQLPSYGLVDAGIMYRYTINSKMRLSLRFNMNNVLDNHYISESWTNILAEDGDETWNGVNTSNNVYFGWGRTWNVSLKFEF